MKGKDMVYAMQYLDDEKIHQAEYGEFSPRNFYRDMGGRKNPRRIFLLAAVIALASVLVGCGVLYVLHRQQLRIADREIYDMPWVELSEENEMGAIPQQVLTTSGPEDSKRYQAAKEWNEFEVSYMLKKAGAGDLAQYFLKGSDAYRAITDTERGFVQEAQSFEFVEESVTEYTAYTDTLFSARVSVMLNEYRSSGTVKESPISQTLFFEKQSSGKWMCYAMTAIDTTEAAVQVRIRFVDQGREVVSDLYDLSQSSISCPAVTPPEGKTFQGWGTESQDEQGNTVMNLILEPDETGFASIPDGLLEEPLTLYAVYQ